MDEPAHAETTNPLNKPWLRWSLRVLRFAVPVLAIGYLLSIVPLREVIHSAGRLPLSSLVLAFLIVIAASAIGTLRWGLLISACGVPNRPRYAELFRAYWVGAFYSTCVPGGVGGEVVRAIATRRVVGERGLPLSLAIVFLDRTAGLTGMLILLATSVTLFPGQGIENVLLFSVLGIGVAAAAVLSIVNGPRLARFLPGPLAKIAAALPTIESLPLFGVALLLSVLTQLSGVLYGHVLISGITPRPSLVDSLLILPLVNASQYFPLTIGGAGIREAGFVVLYGKLGVSKADALAASLLCGAVTYAANAIGGILHLLKPLTLELNDANESAAVQPAPSSASQP